MVNRLIATGLLATILLWLMTACGAGTGPIERDESRGGTGVMAGGFEVIRYNEAGFPDPQLNGTLDVALREQDGQTALVINVSDNILTGIVAIDVRYNAGSVHPEEAVFHDLLGSPSQVLSASFLTNVPGVASIGQVGIHDYKPASLDGQFATLTFASGGLRAVSVTDGVHTNPEGVSDVMFDHAQNTLPETPNMWAIPDETVPNVSLHWSAAWNLADGNQNGIVEIADLSPIGKFLDESVAENFAAAPADYDGNGQVNIAELSTMGKYLSEGTATYLVEVGDDGATDGFTTITTLDWTLTEGDDWTAPSDPNIVTVPDPIDLGTVFKTWNLLFDSSSAFTIEQVAEADVNGNDNVTFRVTPQRAGLNGVPGTVDATVIVSTTRFITVNNVTIRVDGATGGLEDGAVFDADNDDSGEVVANQTVTITVEDISGTYSSNAGGGAFDSATLPADMTQQDYDDALAEVRARVTWDIANGGAPGFRARSEWVTFNPPPPAQGDLGAGTVFPDDDPESTGAEAEGLLRLNLAANADVDGDPERVIAFTTFTHEFLFDVSADPSAPLMAEPIDLADGEVATELVLLVGTEVQIDLTVATPIADPTQTQLWLYEIGVDGLAVGTPIQFNYAPPADSQGEFFFRTVDPANLQAFVTGSLTPGSQYHFAWNDAGGPSSSLNIPGSLLVTVPEPPPADLTTVPDVIANPFETDVDIYQFRIFHPDPEIRRGRVVNIDPVTGNLIWEEPFDPNEVAFNDVLKIAGDNFITTAKDGQVYPRVTVIWNDPENPVPGDQFTPDLIDATTPGLEDEFKVIVLSPHPNFLTVDCLGLDWHLNENPANPDGVTEMAYKVFNVTDSAAGQGELLAANFRLDDPPPSAVNWGVNVYNRDATADKTIADLPSLYTNRTANQATVFDAGGNLGNTPDVLWFEFSGGYMFDFNPDDGDNNVKVVLEPWSESGEFFNDTAVIDLRLAGVNGTNNYLAFHVLEPNDFFEYGGNLFAGWSYFLHLDDWRLSGDWQATYGEGNPAPDGDPYLLTVINNP